MTLPQRYLLTLTQHRRTWWAFGLILRHVKTIEVTEQEGCGTIEELRAHLHRKFPKVENISYERIDE